MRALGPEINRDKSNLPEYRCCRSVLWVRGISSHLAITKCRLYDDDSFLQRIAIARSRELPGYARVSTADQDLAGQVTRLEDAEVIRVFEDVVSGKQFDRPGLPALMEHARPGCSLTVTRLDRLGRSIKDLLGTDENPKIKTASKSGSFLFSEPSLS